MKFKNILSTTILMFAFAAFSPHADAQTKQKTSVTYFTHTETNNSSQRDTLQDSTAVFVRPIEWECIMRWDSLSGATKGTFLIDHKMAGRTNYANLITESIDGVTGTKRYTGKIESGNLKFTTMIDTSQSTKVDGDIGTFEPYKKE
jgi:hypothetical protein